MKYIKLHNEIFKKTNKWDLTGFDYSTLHIMQDFDNGCQARCPFCSQSANDTLLVDNEFVKFPLDKFLKRINGNIISGLPFKRICILTVYHEDSVEHLIELVKELKKVSTIPITVCSSQVTKENMEELKMNGVTNITISYEVSTPEMFLKARSDKYNWDMITKTITDALSIFGRGNVGSHLLVGFGETDYDNLSFIQNLYDIGVLVSLFCFKPMEGTLFEKLERLPYKNYHRMQIGSYLIQNGIKTINDFSFDEDKNIIQYGLSCFELDKLIDTGIPFRLSGCPDCNRIYYDTKPGERFYSYPRKLNNDEIDLIKKEMRGV